MNNIPAEQIALFSDVVKIGFPVIGTMFGAVIGAFSTYLITRLNQTHDSKKEYAKRRYEMLTQTANDVTEFEHLICCYTSEAVSCINGRKRDNELHATREALMKNNIPLRRARMSLKLLGLVTAEALLEEYIELTREVVKGGTTISKERIDVLAAQIVVGPTKFYASLSEAFS
jgi:hypothetical protein